VDRENKCPGTSRNNQDNFGGKKPSYSETMEFGSIVIYAWL
jgi:hypothetical protein